MEKIFEFTEFNGLRMNQDALPQSMYVQDPSLTFDPYNKFMANNVSANKKLIDAAKSMSTSSDFFDNFFSANNAKFFNISDLKILRLIQLNNKIDIYYSFKYDEIEFFGVIKEYNTPEPIVKCELYNNYKQLLTKEFVIKFNGMLLKCFNSWFRISNGKYKCLKSIPIINTQTGAIKQTKINDKLNIVKVSDNEIFVNISDIIYKISDINYYYFNYYFEKLV